MSNHQVTHIGYALFTPYQRAQSPSPVLNFLERYSLALDLPIERLKTTAKQIQEDDIHFTIGSFDTLKQFASDTTCNISITNNNGKRYFVEWSRNDSIFCALDFPVSYNLLQGSDMLENEMRIKQELKNQLIRKYTPKPVTREELIPTWQNNYYILPGESYYTDKLTSNLYYEQDSTGEYRLIYNNKYLLESLANLFTTTDIDNKYIIHIYLKKYGNEREYIDVPLKKWICFCLENGCKPFFGVIKFEGEFADCELVMRNRTEGYDHVMRIHFNISRLDDKEGDIDARLISFVPTFSIKYLFEEFKK